MAPPAKRPKVSLEGGGAALSKGAAAEEGDAAAEAEAEPEVEELELDAPVSSGTRLAERAGFLAQDTTVNALASTVGNMLMPIMDGGFQHLLAGARCNIGLTSGRYMFEVKFVDAPNLPEEATARSRVQLPRQLLRVGFATSGARLLMGEGEDNMCFVSEGGVLHKGVCNPGGESFTRDNIVGVMLNLDAGSSNYNTVSLFKDGVRASTPIPLPESWQGKALHPAVTFKNLGLHVNFGPVPIAPLPFVCRMVSDVDASHAVVAKPCTPSDGRHEVLLPVGLPDRGAFDWLDFFLERNPHFTELSDRALLEWCRRSGILRPKGYAQRSSMDKPEMVFGISSLDDLSVRRILQIAAPLQPRSFVVMEVRGNLLREERLAALARFPSTRFRSVAAVLAGQPSEEFRRRIQDLLLQEKQEVVDAEFSARKAEERRKFALQKKAKELEKSKLKAQKEGKKAEEARAKQLRKKDPDKDRDEGGEDCDPDDESKEQSGDTTVQKEQEEEKSEEEYEDNETPPKAELSPEEQQLRFRASPVSDLTPLAMSTSFANFSLPEKSEGFDEIRYEWEEEKASQEFLRRWTVERKLTTRIEDISPSSWFHEQWGKWQAAMQAWQAKLVDIQLAAARKAAAALEPSTSMEGTADAVGADQGATAVQAKEGPSVTETRGGEFEDVQAAAGGDDRADAAAEPLEAEGTFEEVDFASLDVFGVRDIMDVGGGLPLFREFQFQDWAMTTLRFELHLLAHSFCKDAADPERLGIHIDHLTYYYSRYYKKSLIPKLYGVDHMQDLLKLVQDTLFVNESQIIEPLLPDDLQSFAIFAKLAEEDRRHRRLLVEVGQEDARLRLQLPAPMRASGRGVAGGRIGGGRAPRGRSYEDAAMRELDPDYDICWQGRKCTRKTCKYIHPDGRDIDLI